MIDCLPYFGIFALIFIINVVAIKQKNVHIRKCLIILGFIILLGFVGLRYEVGTDYGNYLDMYKTVANVSWERIFSIDIEPFVSLIFKISSLILWDPRLIFVIIAFLMLWPIYRVNKLYDYKYLPYSILVYSVLFLPFGLNGMRQGIAMSFALLSFIYLNRKHFMKGVINFIIAILFHTSSLVILPYVIAITVCKRRKMNFTRLNILITVILSVAVLLFLNNILIYTGFSQYDYILGNIDITKISFIDVLTYAPVAILPFLFSMNEADNEEFVILRNLVISGIIFTVIGTTAQYLSRFGLFFLMPSIILLPQSVQSISEKNTRITAKCLLIVYLVLFFCLQYYSWGKHEIIPYQTWIWSDMI